MTEQLCRACAKTIAEDQLVQSPGGRFGNCAGGCGCDSSRYDGAGELWDYYVIFWSVSSFYVNHSQRQKTLD